MRKKDVFAISTGIKSSHYRAPGWTFCEEVELDEPSTPYDTEADIGIMVGKGECYNLADLRGRTKRHNRKTIIAKNRAAADQNHHMNTGTENNGPKNNIR